ncbi:two-component regulator propeller domain-containing protein [Neotamlana laminarinivorans]|uniref:Helix-turn-helix domain-containing protein n=1 Tax=Neotamlana laminarinivorans TaxID=2883124 RepID=A0A9X1I0C2_9FLAO|nr:two-component regulator propeller domain-containing protein [Tamlana laminarinivorans]MCB4797947.1 helix-turn-helix domain-containing protein [Tamlana laminarinivorans]
MIRIFLACFFIPAIIYCQQIKFKNFITENGLSNNSVSDIENDTNGGLWIATWDGLNYFDGYTIKTFKHEVGNSKSIPHNYLLRLEKDKNDNIWIFSNNGDVTQYIKNNTFKTYEFDGVVTNMDLSDDKTILVKVNNTYYEFKNNSFCKTKKYPKQNKSYKHFVKTLLDKYPNVSVNDVYNDDFGNVWFATVRNGLFIIPNHTNNVLNTTINQYKHDKYNPYSINSNEVEKIHQDVFGNIWLAQKDGGLSMAYSGSENIATVVPHPIKFPHLPNETLRAITKDNNGVIWLGYYNSGLYYFDLTTQCYQKFKIAEAKVNKDWERIRMLFTASDGSIWVGTYAGLIQIKNNNYKFFKAEDNGLFPNNRNYSVFEDDNNQLWIGCWGGLAKFNLKKNKFEHFNGQELFSKLNIRNVKKIANEIIVGTEQNGIFIYNISTEKIQQITTSNNLLGNSIYCVYKDLTNNYYWVASLGGISVLNENKKVIKNITEENGLPSHMVYSILKNKNHFWVSTTKGIANINKSTYKVTGYNPNEGWQASEFSEGAYYQDKKGLLFFGGVNGLNYFNPNGLKENKISSSVTVLVDGSSTFKSQILKSYNTNSLELDFTIISFLDKSKPHNFYKLDGVNKNWLPITESKKVVYKNLKPGIYTLLLRKENEIEQEFLNLIIKKPFYKTTLFYGFLIGALCLGIVLVITIKNRIAKKTEQKLENQILLRTKVIEKQKQDLQLFNIQLDKKNRQILEQKEKLLNLHTNLKNEDFEVEKFKTFVLSQFQEPIFKIIKKVNKFENNNLLKEEIIKESGKLVELISEWNYLDHIKDIGPVKKTAIILPRLLKHTVAKLNKQAQFQNINLKCNIEVIQSWIFIDVLRFRLLLQYFFTDTVKYIETGSALNINIITEVNNILIILNTNSSVLKANLKNILSYSPYFESVKVLLGNLEGNLENKIEDQTSITMSIPFELVENEPPKLNIVNWKHFEKQNQENKFNQTILIFTEKENNSIANQILENKGFNLIFENSIEDLIVALNQISVDIMVFYQAKFSKELVGFFNALKQNKLIKNVKVPMLYISEDIAYGMQEQITDFGIDVLVQMPASDQLIIKKITALINKKDKVLHASLQKEIFNILTSETKILSPNDKLLKSGLEIIKNELSNPLFNVEMLVYKMGISRVKCYRLFKELLQKSPSDIITSLRLQKAATLLKSKNLNISEISFECGYNDPKYFGRSFKKHFGCSPKEFKAQYC